MAVIYIAGPMTGLPDFNRPAFNQVAHELREQGHAVFNPAETRLPETATWEDYMREGIVDLMHCNTIYLLPGFEKSRGATIELELAKDLGMTITYQEGK